MSRKKVKISVTDGSGNNFVIEESSGTPWYWLGDDEKKDDIHMLKCGVKVRGALGKSCKIIPLDDMKPGQIGIIQKWGNNHDAIGLVVQMDYNRASLFILGYYDKWSNLKDFFGNEHLIKILPKGTLLEVIRED